MTRHWIGLAVIVIAATLLLAWDNYYPPSPMIPAAGLAGERGPDAGRRCGPFYRHTRFGPLALRRGSCSLSPRTERLRFDRLSRKVTRVYRSWDVADSAQWAHAHDSVASALEALGGKRMSCPDLQRTPLSLTITNEVWRFSGYDVRLLTYRRIPGNVAREWSLQIDGFAHGAPECGGRPPFDG